MTGSVDSGRPVSPSQSATYADWRAAAEHELKGVRSERSLVTHTPEGIDVQALYRREDAAALASADGVLETVFWRGSPERDGRAWRWEAWIGPSEYDFSPLPALAVALSRPRVDALTARLTAADPIGWLLRHGSLPMPLAVCCDDLADGMRAAAEAGASLRIAAVGAHIWHEGGATAVQELAFGLATGAEYWRWLLNREIPPDQIGARMQLTLAAGVDFFTSLAKLRAARVLWAKMTAAFGPEPAGRPVFLAARTAARDKTRYDPHVNLLRLTTQALSAVVGGADAIEIRPFDEIAGGPTDLGDRLSRNLHEILAEEFGLEHVADPAGGSWYVEVFTAQLARQAWALFQEIEKRGGMAEAVLAGYPQSLAARAAEDEQVRVDTRCRPILGTTLQPNLQEEPIRAPTVAAAARRRRPSKPKPIKSFSALQAAAVKRTTLPTLRLAWTQKRDPGPTAPALQLARAAEGFEAVRRAGDEFLARTGRRARVFLAKIGPPQQHQARAGFAAGFFAIAGFEANSHPGFTTAEAAADAAVASGAAIAVLCSADDTHPRLAPVFARRVKAARPALAVVLAGHPGEREQEYRAAGVDEFIHVRCNAQTTLAQLQRRVGIRP
ncbi:MAG TPA: methylmalonyl-CoA mutase family protein [Opitutaceae bacterium]|nr:methylmalonyl-CoA mutase family protein [Opitutaceae bacterium]